MIAFLMFFYFFIFVSMLVAFTEKEAAVVHIVTKELAFYHDCDGEDGEDSEDTSITHEIHHDLSDEVFQIEMKTKIKNENILYEFHSYLTECNINEDTNIITVEDDDVLWNVKYSSNVYEKFYDSLIEYINENYLSENLVVYLNGEIIQTQQVDLIT